MNVRVQQNFVWTTLGTVMFWMGCAQKLVVDEGVAEGGGGSNQAPVASGGDSNDSTSSTTAEPDAADTTGSVEHTSDYCSSRLPPEGSLWTGSAEGCPETSPTAWSCDGSVRGLCTYISEENGATTSCSCLYDRFAGEPRWSCEPAGDYSFRDCPALPPPDGSSCFGSRGHQCAYPSPLLVVCDCSDTDNPAWQCSDITNGREALPLEPADVDLQTPVSELTEAERAEVCEWLEQWARGGLGYPPGDPAEVGSDGFTVNGGCSVKTIFRDAYAFPTTLAREQCEANLVLSSCEAPLSELVDCVIAIRDSDLEHQRSCGPYLERPACNGTSVTAHDICNSSVPTQEACSIQVE